MRTCHYQDRPGKRSLCLRKIVDDVATFEEMRWSFCDDVEECPHRGWDPERRVKVMISRIELLGECGECGRMHDLVIDQLNCHLEGRMGRVLMEMGPPKGSKEPLLDHWFPRSLKERAWRKVRAAVIERDGRTCIDCGRSLKEYPGWYTEVHHIIPVIDGGSDHPSNLVTLCVECHGSYTDDICRQAMVGRPKCPGEGDSHRKRPRSSQSVLDDAIER
ncbi:MAG: HNH endonuclease [Euryarchaeota archaeon]|nr:HNH endonuclease [Euryarchaeota archaeon]